MATWIAGALVIGVVALVMVISPQAKAKAAGDWHTQGNQIISPDGSPYRIAGVNWYGFETPDHVAHGLWAQNYKKIIDQISALGYNSIRLPFSDELVSKNPVPSIPGNANPEFAGKKALDIMDAIINQAGKDGLMVILDNHRSEAGQSAENSGLWYGGGYSAEQFQQNWVTMAKRYASNPTVLGFDLRNEPHSPGAYGQGGSTWGTGDASTDWRLAAEKAGNAVLGAAPSKLVFVEGISSAAGDGAESTWWGGNLSGARTAPVRLDSKNKLVYAAHEYGPAEFQQKWFNGSTTADSLAKHFDHFWGYLSREGTAPVWVGEWGTPNDDASVTGSGAGSQGQWFQAMTSYLAANPNIGWSYWAANGEDRYGLLNSEYTAPASAAKQAALAKIQSGNGVPGGAAAAPAPSETAADPTPTPAADSPAPDNSLAPTADAPAAVPTADGSADVPGPDPTADSPAPDASPVPTADSPSPQPTGDAPADPWADQPTGDAPADPWADQPTGDAPADPWADQPTGDQPAGPGSAGAAGAAGADQPSDSSGAGSGQADPSTGAGSGDPGNGCTALADLPNLPESAWKLPTGPGLPTMPSRTASRSEALARANEIYQRLAEQNHWKQLLVQRQKIVAHQREVAQQLRQGGVF